MRRLAILLLALATPASAQEPSALVTRAVSAYEGLDLEAASALLRRALSPPVVDSLSKAERTRALSYLGAIELLSEHRDSAQAVFRRLVLFDPRYRADTYLFPPEVTRVFDEVRLRTRVVAVRIPADTVVPVQQGRLVVWLFPSAPHDVTVSIAREDGHALRTLYAGAAGDSLPVRWDGRDSSGALTPSGKVWLTVLSRSGGNASDRLVQLPLQVDVAMDTVARPAAPPRELSPGERAERRSARRSLTSGILIGAAAVLLPQIVAPGERSSGTRIAVGGTLAVSGLVGYLSQPRRAPNPVAANQPRRSDTLVAKSLRVRTLGPAAVIDRGERGR